MGSETHLQTLEGQNEKPVPRSSIWGCEPLPGILARLPSESGKGLSERPRGELCPTLLFLHHQLVAPTLREKTETRFQRNFPHFSGEGKWHQKPPQWATGIATAPRSLGVRKGCGPRHQSPVSRPGLAGTLPPQYSSCGQYTELQQTNIRDVMSRRPSEVNILAQERRRAG